jgi:hypothetical protein
VQIGAPTDAATGAVKWSAGQKRYPLRMERAAQITRKHNYLFLQPQHLELLLEVNMASRAKHGWSVLQSAFTAPKFSASVGDALSYTSQNFK